MVLLRILSIVSGILGIAVLISSSVFIHEFRYTYFQFGCNSYYYSPMFGEWCHYVDMYMIAGGLGIAAGILQFVSSPLGWTKKWKVWCVVQVFVFLITIVAFSLALDKNANKWNWATGEKAKTFIAFTGIDFIFSVISIIVVIFMNQKNKEDE